jgi:cytochrome b
MGRKSGPIPALIDFAQARKTPALHKTIFNLLLGFLAIHITAILYYLISSAEI